MPMINPFYCNSPTCKQGKDSIFHSFRAGKTKAMRSCWNKMSIHPALNLSNSHAHEENTYANLISKLNSLKIQERTFHADRPKGKRLRNKVWSIRNRCSSTLGLSIWEKYSSQLGRQNRYNLCCWRSLLERFSGWHSTKTTSAETGICSLIAASRF